VWGFSVDVLDETIQGLKITCDEEILGCSLGDI
jgi:hypothetical protein